MQMAPKTVANYMDRQRDLTPEFRSVLVDWLVDVADEFRITRQTLHMAVAYINRCLPPSPPPPQTFENLTKFLI